MVLRLYFVLWIISSSPGGAGKSFESVSLGYKKYHSDACSTTTELWVNEDDKIFHNFYFIHWCSLRIHHFWVQSQHSLDDELLSSIYSENSYLATHKFKSSIQVPIDMRTVCWRAHKEKYNDRAMINFIPTEDKRKCAACQYGYLWCFFRVVTACVEMNPLQVPQVWTFRLLDSSCIFRSSEMLFEVIIINYYLLNHINISFLSTWVSELHRN